MEISFSAMISVLLVSPLAQGTNQPPLPGGKQVGHGPCVVPQRFRHLQCHTDIDTRDATHAAQAKLAGCLQNQVPGLRAFLGSQLILRIRTAFAAPIGIGIYASTGTGESLLAAPPAIVRPAAEVPFGEGLEAFPSATASA